MQRAWVGLAALVLASGCLAPASQPAGVPDTSADLTHPLERMPVTRAAVASVSMHEEVDGSVVDLPFADGDQPWAPRDVDLTYHGIQTVHDEFSRPVPAFVFRFPHMVFVTDEIRFDANGVGIDGHYEPHDIEFHFAASDGHLIGLVDASALVRVWTSPDGHSPFGSLAVASMAFKVFEAGGRQPLRVREVDGHALYYSFEPANGTAPLPGNCVAWELDSYWDPPFPESATEQAEEIVPEEDGRTLICMEAGREVPLWAWSGTSEGSYRLQREAGADLPTPTFAGEPVPPVDYHELPWQEVNGPLGVPGPLLVPPTADGGRWAQEVAERAASLYFSPGYLRYRLASDLPYVDVAFLDIDLGSLLNLTLPPLPLLGGRQSRVSLYMMTDTNTSHAHLITTQEGEPEGPDIHVAEPQGSDWPDQFGTPLPASRLPPLVPDADLEGRLGPLLAERVDRLTFIFVTFEWPSGSTESIAQWSILQDCTQTEDGWAAAVDGLQGNILAALQMPAGGADCGDRASRWAEPVRSDLWPSWPIGTGPGAPGAEPLGRFPAATWARGWP